MLPEMTADNLVGVGFIVGRSAFPGHVAVWEVRAGIQDTITDPGQVVPHGSFPCEEVLEWAYNSRLCEATQFEAIPFWWMLEGYVGQSPAGLMSLRPMMMQNLDAIGVLANMSAEDLARRFPTLPVAA